MPTKRIVKHRNNCRGCKRKDLVMVLDLGEMPLAGGFLSPKEIKKEQKIPLKVYFCQNCGLVQILDVIDPSVLFKNYFYLSSVIKSLSLHFQEYADFLIKNYLTEKDAKILEFGCNDGVLLQYLEKNKKIQAFGIDPSKNVSKMARDKGFNVKTGYFDRKTAASMKKNIGPVDVVTGSNVFAHVDDIDEIIKAAQVILKPNGVFIIEVHYLKDLLDKFQYDTIYHEHLCYYSVTALKNIFALSDMKIIEVVHLEMHGGGIRVVAAMNSSKKVPNTSVAKFIKNEKSINKNKMISFGKSCISHRAKLVSLLDKLKKNGKSIVGYGAPGRGTILLNYCGIDSKYLDYIVDVSPLRAGMLMPGVHIPIYSPEKSRQTPPDYFLLLAWNYADSIFDQEKKLIKQGVKFIIPFPKIKII